MRHMSVRQGSGRQDNERIKHLTGQSFEANRFPLNGRGSQSQGGQGAFGGGMFTQPHPPPPWAEQKGKRSAQCSFPSAKN